MTPESYATVKKIFADAIARPESERDAYVRKACGDDQEVLNEVVSLLKYHSEQSLLQTIEVSMMTGTDGTIEIASAKAIPPAPTMLTAESASFSTQELLAPPIAKPAVPDPLSKTDLDQRFELSTVRLLRQRLIQAIGLTLLIAVTITCFGIYYDTVSKSGLAIRFSIVWMQLGFGWILWRAGPLSLVEVRRLELLVIAAPTVELMLLLVRYTNNLIEINDTANLDELHAMVSLVLAIYIAVYGILIPSPWQRTAAITFTLALMPTLTILLHRYINGLSEDTEVVHWANPVLTCLMAAVATFGSSVVHGVRREAEAARLYGQYRLTDEIGRGAMGVVYRAEHNLLKRPAAIKLIRTDFASDSKTIKRFEDEVQISATLSHWNTVQIYDYGRTASGEFYFVMEFLDGESLEERLLRRGVRTLKETLSVVIQTCAGLSEAHHRGMVHRDIKPSNLFLARLGGEPDVVKIVDFGLALARNSGTAKADKTICGTPRYMSPEQIRGQEVDGRSDIYAIGCTAVECLTGCPPFMAATMSELLSEHLFRVPRLDQVKRINQDLAKVLSRCLEKDPDRRFATVDELRSACLEIAKQVDESIAIG